MKLRFNVTQGFLLALLVHVLVIGILFFSADSEKSIKPRPSDAEPKIMDAVVIDLSEIKAEKQKIIDTENKKLAEQEKRKEEEKRLEDLKKQKKEVEKKRIAEEKKLKKVEKDRKQKEIENKKLEKQKLEQEKLLLEDQKRKEAEQQAKLEADQLKKEEELKKIEQQRLKEEEAQEKAEQERLQKEAEEEQKRLEQEAIKKAEAEEKRKEEEARQKAEAEDKRKADEERKQREAEIEAEEAARGKEIAGSYYGKIAGQVERNFNISGFESGLKCLLEIKMVPGGDVISVKVIESSGDARFDRQAEIAAQKASPLPVPDDIKIFNQYFRTIKFRFNPG